MKKTIYLLFIILATSGLVNAQLFVGGHFNFNTSAGKTDDAGTTTDNPSHVNFNFSPKAGYMISDDFWVGAALSMGLTHSNSKDVVEVINNSTSFGIYPFARYYAFRLNKFSFFGQGQLGMAFSSSKTKTDGNSTDGPKSTTLSFRVFPGIAYDISDKFQLEAEINGFNLGVSHNITKDGDIKDQSTDAGFGVTLDNIVTTGNISIGAIYKF
jgi:outer membrane protein